MGSMADTARLLASLELRDNFTKGIKTATASLGRLESSVGKVGSKIGGIASKGLRNLGNNIKSLVTSPLGLLGLGAGLLSVQQFLSGSVDKAQEFADAVMRTQAITGMAVKETSQLVDVLGDYGMEIDKVKTMAGLYGKATGLLTKGNANYKKELKAAEKELGRHLTATEKLRISQKNAIKFQKEFGFNILDSNGKVKDFRTALLDAAAVFTDKSIPASRKAALMMKLFGRNWQELIPLLKKGKAGLEATLGKGLVLTEAQQKSLDKSRIATRKWQDALDELQIAIGVELLPVITRFQKRATTFITEHGPEIVDFFRKAGKWAIGMGTAIKNDVLPVLGRIGDFWSGLPDDLKKVLIGGFVINKATGGALTGIVSEIGKGLIKGVLGITAAVVNINAGTVTGAGGVPGTGAGGAAGGAGALAGGLVVGATVGAVVVGAAVTKGMIDAADETARKYPQLTKAELIAIQVQGNGGLENIGLRAKNEVTNQLKAMGTDYETALRSATSKIRGGAAQDTNKVRAAQAATTSQVRGMATSTNRNLDQVTSAIRNKKLQVHFKLSQRQAQAIRANLGSTAQGRPGFHYTKMNEHSLDVDRVLARGEVGIANAPVSAIFGEAGREAYAILKNPRRGMIGGGGNVNVKVVVNIDPRRITKKQTSSGVYKTYVAT